MYGPSHPGSPPTWLQQNRNGEQYAFKVINIGEYVKVIYMCQLPAAS